MYKQRELGLLAELEDLGDLNGKRVLVRVDFNVPMENGEVADDFRIRAALPTLTWLIEAGAEVVVCTHLGRPNGEVVPDLSTAPIAKVLGELLPGVELMENLRFDPREDAGELSLTEELISGFDAYVNDAFAFCHRPTASIVGPPKYLPSAAGRLIKRELEVMDGLIDIELRPFIGILGGAKVSDKIGLVRELSERVDNLLIGGAMAVTFLAAQDHKMGNSMVEPNMEKTCLELLRDCPNIVLPTDLMVELEDKTTEVTNLDVPEGGRALDIGPKSTLHFGRLIDHGSVIFWNGPMGLFEDERFASGTLGVAAAMTRSLALTVVGGGDSAAAVKKFGLFDNMTHVSTGGGASLEYIEHGDLVGLEALRKAPNVRGE